MTQPSAPWPQPQGHQQAPPPKQDGAIAVMVIVGVVFAGMMVLAVVGILAAIAIPNFLKFQLRSKAAEAKMNVRAISTAELERFAEKGEFVAAGPSPAGAPGRERRQFVADPGFEELHFAPETPVYYQYEVEVGPDGKSATVLARGDLDGDGEIAVYVQKLDGASRQEMVDPPRNAF